MLGLDLYKNDHFFLLLTGEGVQPTTETVAHALGAFSAEITSVLNLGIAGALLPSLAFGTCVSVRTTYAEKNNSEPQFKSFTASDAHAEVDCITAASRVLTDEHAKALRPFAAVVDRELWGIASVATRFGKPFQSVKIVSDLAGSATNCFDLSHRAEEFANLLEQQFVKIQPEGLDTAASANALPERLAAHFYFTTAQERQFAKLMESLTRKFSCEPSTILEKLPLKEIEAEDTPAKQRTSALLQEMEFLLSPFKRRVKHALNQQTSRLREAGFEVKFDKSLEREGFQLTAQIEHEKHIQKLNAALAEFDYKPIKNTFNGDLGDTHG